MLFDHGEDPSDILPCFLEVYQIGGSVVVQFRNIEAEFDSRLAVGQAIVFRGLPSSSTVRRRQTTIVCATPG
ncbi:MAG: hypothetical protein ABSG56_37130 [Bryobacteraceae bacterium]|jgi:hypothetical protein